MEAMTIRYELQRQDVQAAVRSMTKGTWIRWVIFLVPGLMTVIVVVSSIMSGNWDGIRQVAPVAVVVSIFFVGLVWLQPLLLAKKFILRPVEWQLSPEGVRIITDVSTGDLRWQAFTKYVETDKVFLLYIQKGQAQFIPKRAIPPEELAQLRELLAAQVKKG